MGRTLAAMMRKPAREIVVIDKMDLCEGEERILTVVIDKSSERNVKCGYVEVKIGAHVPNLQTCALGSVLISPVDA